MEFLTGEFEHIVAILVLGWVCNLVTAPTFGALLKPKRALKVTFWLSLLVPYLTFSWAIIWVINDAI